MIHKKFEVVDHEQVQLLCINVGKVVSPPAHTKESRDGTRAMLLQVLL